MLRREVVIEPDRNGMYFVDGYINGKSVKFCVDTGASGIAITDEKADAIGLNWRSGFKGHSNTVGGLTDRWSMPLHSVRIGDIEVRKGLVGGVIPAMDLVRADALLGMSFLREIEFTQDDGKLILQDDSPETVPAMGSDRWWDKKESDEEDEGSSQGDSKEDSSRGDSTRKEEIDQAEHEAKMAQIEFVESEAKRKLAWSQKTTPMVYDVDKDGDGTITEQEKIAHETGGGVLGLWWLTPEEAITIGISAMLVIFTLGMGVIVSSDEVDWATAEGTVLVGTSWWEEEYEMEDCLYDEYNDEYYDCYYYYEYECGAVVDYGFAIDGVEYSGVDGVNLGIWDDYCLEEVEFNVLPLNSPVTVWYDKENPENNHLSEPGGTQFIIFYCCMPFFLIILLVTLVNARLSNSPKDLDYGESRIVDGMPGMFRTDSEGGIAGTGGGVHHHYHGSHGRWGWGRRMFGRPRGVRRARSRVRTGGRRSGGRRSTGGGRRSGGGGRRSSGGGGRRSG